MQFKFKDFRHFPWEKNPPCWKIPSLDLLLPLFMLHLRNNDTFYPDNIFLKGGIVKNIKCIWLKKENIIKCTDINLHWTYYIYKQSAMVLFWMHIICFSTHNWHLKSKINRLFYSRKQRTNYTSSIEHPKNYVSQCRMYLLDNWITPTIDTENKYSMTYYFHIQVSSTCYVIFSEIILYD